MRSTTTRQPLSRSIIEVVAEAENVDPLELETPLYNAINPDALDALFASTIAVARPQGKVIFEYCGHTVVVGSNGTVSLSDEPGGA